VDSNPVAVSIASAKLGSVSPEKIITLCENILRSHKSPQDIPRGDFWDLAFAPKTLIEICKLREYLLRDLESDEAVALRAVVLGALHGPRTKTQPSYLSNQMPRTYATKPSPAVNFWRRRGLLPEPVDTLTVLMKKISWYFSDLPRKVHGSIIQADSRSVDFSQFGRFDFVITSPPYLGMRTYVPDQWLRNWFLGGPGTVAYEGPPQLGRGSRAKFGDDLAEVWRNVAKGCSPNASLIVRFGVLPSVQVDARALLKRTFDKADAGWRILTIRNAGTAREGKRQSDQFSMSSSSPLAEFDLHARLET
jgi:hypothetical protein